MNQTGVISMRWKAPEAAKIVQRAPQCRPSGQVSLLSHQFEVAWHVKIGSGAQNWSSRPTAGRSLNMSLGDKFFFSDFRGLGPTNTIRIDPYLSYRYLHGQSRSVSGSLRQISIGFACSERRSVKKCNFFQKKLKVTPSNTCESPHFWLQWNRKGRLG